MLDATVQEFTARTNTTRERFGGFSSIDRVSWLNEESGIDVQAELKVKTEGSQAIPHSSPTTNMPHPSPAQRAVINRQGQARRSMSGPGSKALRPLQALSHARPRLQPTPPSSTISPTATKSPLGKFGLDQQPRLEPRPHSRSEPSSLSIPASVASGSTMKPTTPSTTDGSRSSEFGGAAHAQTNFYPSQFQSHLEQLGKLARPLLFNRTLFVLD